MESANTRITYCYRDASNYKFWGEFVVEGQLNRSQLEPYLFDGGWFVPEKVGLKHLLTEAWSEDDHLLHELCDFEYTTTSGAICSADLFVERFKAAHRNDWFSGY